MFLLIQSHVAAAIAAVTTVTTILIVTTLVVQATVIVPFHESVFKLEQHQSGVNPTKPRLFVLVFIIIIIED